MAKFSYLKELLVPKVRSAVDGLPYNTEGYERAKAILTAKYGKPSEVANAHIQSIIALPTVPGSQPARVHNFYEKLATNVQALDTMGRIKEINGYVRVTLDKLPGIRADLVCLDDNWHDWVFPQMFEALCKWCDRNPLHSSNQSNKSRDRFFNSRQEDYLQRPCIYCTSTSHKSVNCDKIASVGDRGRKLLCFSYIGQAPWETTSQNRVQEDLHDALLSQPENCTV